MDLFEILTQGNEETPELIEKANMYLNDPFSAKIKKEFILLNMTEIDTSQKEIKSESGVIENDENSLGKKHLISTSDESSNKKFKKSESKNAQRKQIKLLRESNIKLCPAFSKCSKCQYGDKCKYSHDLKEYFDKKLEDIDKNCYSFDTYGYCPFGLACRFSSSHIRYDAEANTYENLRNEEISNKVKPCMIYNILDSDLKSKLWKRKYNFSLTEKINKSVAEYMKTNNTIIDLKYNRNKGSVSVKQENTDTSTITATKPSDEEETAQNDKNIESKKIGLVTDEDLIKLRTGEKKKIDWKNKLYLAPLTTVGNLPFRRICKQFGADITCCEMAMSTNLFQGQVSEWALLKRHESEDLFGVQLAGSYADQLTKASQLIKENCNVDFVDINCGCPIDIVFDKGAGCALMTRLNEFQKIIRSLDILLDVPVTAKIRTGVKAADIIPQLKSWGVDMITLHGRTRQQRYSKLADWDYIDQCSKLSDPIPLFGCGDILSPLDYNEHMKNTSISGCMIARGALYKPWLFTEIKENRDWDISASERFDMLKKFANYGLEHWGSDTQGVEATRRFLLEWLSFLYRYIPVGILERLPQRINERPPSFFCRNQLETLMASPNSSDWIKISEFFLGPVPENFKFVAKHKANGY